MYILHFIVGGILFSLIHYFSKRKQSKLCALVPALPVLGLIGLMYISKGEKRQIDKYLKNIIIFFVVYIVFFSFMYFLYQKTTNILYSCLLSLILWFMIMYIVLC